MFKKALVALPLLAVCLSSCGAGFYGSPRPVRLAHIDGSTQVGKFNCVSGVLTAPQSGPESMQSGNLGLNFSRDVCAAIAAQDSQDATKDMLESGITLVKVRCTDFFAAKRANQSRARLTRSLIQPLTVAVTSTFAVLNFGSEQRESDALALLAAGNALATAGLDIYEDQFLFGAENVTSVEAMTLRALAAHETDILNANLTSFNRGVRALLDHQNICTPGNILNLVQASIDAGNFRARRTSDDEIENGEIPLTVPPVTDEDEVEERSSAQDGAIPLTAPPLSGS